MRAYNLALRRLRQIGSLSRPAQTAQSEGLPQKQNKDAFQEKYPVEEH